MTGEPDPHLAIQAVGIFAIPFSTVNPFFVNTDVMYLEVSTS